MMKTADCRLIYRVNDWIMKGTLHAEEVADFCEKTVARPLHVLEPELMRLLHHPAIANVDKRAGDRAIAEEPVGGKLVRRRAGVDHTIDEDGISIPIAQRRPRTRGILSDQSQEDRPAYLILELHPRNRLGLKARPSG